MSAFVGPLLGLASAAVGAAAGALPSAGAPAPTGATGAAAPHGAREKKIEQAAHDFESVLVRQLLKTSKIGGDSKTSGYGDMAVDSLADGIEKGGGLGLARRIEEALSNRHR